MNIKLSNVQAAVFNVLDEATFRTFDEEKEIKVGDSFSEEIPLPFIFLGEINQSRLDTKTILGKEVTLTIHVASNFRGKEECFEIVEGIEEILNRELNVEGARVIDNRVESINVQEIKANFIEGRVVFKIQMHEEQEEY